MNRIDQIFDAGKLTDLTIRYWSGRRKLRQADLGFDGEVPTELISLGQKNLIPKEMRSKFRNIESKARYYLDNISFPFPIGSARFVPNTAIEELNDNFIEWRKEYHDAIDYFIRHYRSMRRQMLNEYRRKMPDIYKVTAKDGDYKDFTQAFMVALEQLYLPRSAIRERFSFDWTFFEVSAPTVRKTTVRKMKKAREAERKAYAESYRKAQQSVNVFMDEVVQRLRGETVTVCDFVIKKINRGDVVTGKNLGRLDSFIEKFQRLNFMNDTRIDEQLNALRKNFLLGKTGADYKDDITAMRKLNKSLKSVVKSAEDITDVSEVTGEWKRKIILD